MKPLFSVLTVLGLCFLLDVSCTKTNNVTTTQYDTTTVVLRDTVYQTLKNPIVGLWVGTYKIAGGNPADSFYYSFDILSNGTMITTAIGATNNSASTAGPWQLSGTNFTSTLTQLDGGSPLTVQTTTAIYDSVAGTLNGQSTFTQGSGVNQTFLLFRVN